MNKLVCPLLLVPALLVAAPRSADACSCIQGRSVVSSYETADAVFVGKVVSIDEVSDGVGAGLEVALHVEKAFKGVASEQILVYTAAHGAACGYHFTRDEQYLVFAHADNQDRLHVSLCSRTEPLARAGEDIAALGQHLGLDPAPASGPAAPAKTDATSSEGPAEGSNAAPVQTVPPQAGGCAGCTADNRATPGLILLLALLGLRRARRLGRDRRSGVMRRPRSDVLASL